MADSTYLLPDDYEIRFTGIGKAWNYFTADETVVEVPFELWNVGDTTTTADDFRLVPYIEQADSGNDTWDLVADDHSLSTGANDPYTDLIYWVSPADRTPGAQGYDAFIAALEAKLAAGEKPSESCVGWSDPLGGGVQVDKAKLDPDCNGVALMHRMTFVSWNGSVTDDATDGQFYAPTLPETGTIFRIVTSGESVIDAPVLLSPVDASAFERAPRLFWAEPEGIDGEVEIAADREFRSPVAFKAVYGGGGTSSSATVDSIAAGSYFWRVILQSQSGDTIRSGVRTFSVNQTITANEADALPQSLTLLSPSPHPVSGPSRLRFYLPMSSEVRMEAYDLMGRRIAILADGAQSQGWREAAWPEGLSSGVYLVRLRAGSEMQTRQVVVVR